MGLISTSAFGGLASIKSRSFFKTLVLQLSLQEISFVRLSFGPASSVPLHSKFNKVLSKYTLRIELK